MNALPRYYELLYNAHSYSEEVDAFDLDSADADSMRRFRLLELDSAKAQLMLIGYLIDHNEAVLRAMDASLKRSGNAR